MKYGVVTIVHAGTISDAPEISSVLTNVVNFLLSVVGVVAIIGIVIAGVIYLTAAGDEKRIKLAKAALLFSVIGLVIAFGAMVLLKAIGDFFA